MDKRLTRGEIIQGADIAASAFKAGYIAWLKKKSIEKALGPFCFRYLPHFQAGIQTAIIMLKKNRKGKI